MEALRLVFAEDNYLVREGTAALLSRSPELDVVALAQDLDDLLGAVERHRPDVVLTDIRMPPTWTDEGIDAARRIRREDPGVGVVVLSQYAEDAYAVDLLKEGAAGLGYLLKERVSQLEQVVAALRAVAAGDSVIDAKVVEALVARRPVDSGPLAELAPRELAVLREMATGKSNQAIARTLFLSERAVEKNINAVFTKLGLGQEPDINRRVRAVLTFLDRPAAGPASRARGWCPPSRHPRLPMWAARARRTGMPGPPAWSCRRSWSRTWRSSMRRRSLPDEPSWVPRPVPASV